MQTLYYIVLVPMVYLAFAVFFIGSATRLAVLWSGPKTPAPLAIYPVKRPRWLYALYDTFLMPSVRRHAPVLWVFLMAFHACLALLLLGHLELVGDIRLIQIIPHQIFLGGGWVGLILAVCLLFFLFRRFASPVRDLSVPEDYFLLILLLLTVVFGSEMDWARNWYGYGEMGVSEYREYLFSLLRLSPVLPDSLTGTGHSFMLVLHVFFANLFLMFFPFSKIMHAFLALPANKLKRG